MYVDLAGLARYKRDFDAWARGALLPKDAAAARVRTAKAGAVSLVPVQETPLDVFVDFLFSETPPASGDKGPENPSTITGVSSVKVVRTGTNLLALQPSLGSGYLHFEEKGEGKLRIYGTTQSSYDAITLFPVAQALGNMLLRGNTYTASYYGSDSNLSLQIYAKQPNNSYIQLAVCSVSSNTKTFTVPEQSTNVWIRVQTDAGKTVDDTVRVQIELGSTATAFEPYAGTDYTLPLGSTYYGGTLDAASGVMTVTMQYMVADSNAEIIWIGTNFVAWRFLAGLNCIGRAVGTEVCSHFPFDGAWDGSFAHFYATPSSGLYIANPNWTASTYRQYFTDQYNNGTPVTACYQLANPFTVQLTPQQILSLTQSSDYDPRVNTVYSDQSAVQVGYLKHPSAASADLRDAVVSLGGGV